MGLRVLRAGPGATIQDGGRRSFLRYGVTPAGPMDWTAFRTANLALDNDNDAASVEISVGGLEVVCEDEPVPLAFCGGAFLWTHESRTLPAAARILLRPGERLAARAGASGAWTYLAVEGGFDTPLVMGSRATHVRSHMGGIEGRMLREGDDLPVASGTLAAKREVEARIETPWLEEPISQESVRVVLGPQDDYFSQDMVARFFASVFTLTASVDRMAYRFEGPDIEHRRGFNIVSDGIALGAIQIAGDKQPLVLMADRQPTGGYPKIGHVIQADIGRLAQMRPGASCRFVQVEVGEARDALFALEAEIARTLENLRPLRRELTGEMLSDVNLIDGVVSAFEA
ncbi:MAG TPA: biotin-dependent carboxyltransferase family protein [Beijerinckia sp.]|jgi:biotin-dependent carboxylase-like uncharacterized protein|nr:biotin-dependent carboxyltransferase family protein [Beijerinckia sp.]